MTHNEVSVHKCCLLLSYLSRFSNNFIKLGSAWFYCLLSKFVRRTSIKFFTFLDGNQLNLQVKTNLLELSRITIEILQIKLIATHAESLVRKK